MKLALLILSAACAFAQANWFTLTNGDTSCHAHLATPTPPTTLEFVYSCSNPRGSSSGTYSTLGTATDAVTVGLSGPPGSVVCMFAINATAAPVSIGSFGPGPIPPGTVSWQCSSSGQNAGNNAGSIPLAKGKKE